MLLLSQKRKYLLYLLDCCCLQLTDPTDSEEVIAWREYLQLYALDLMYSRNKTRIRDEFGIRGETLTYCTSQLRKQETRSTFLRDILTTL